MQYLHILNYCTSLFNLSLTAELSSDPNSIDETFTYNNLHNELKDIVDWFELGIQLRFKISTLEEIKQSHNGNVARCKHDMLIRYSKYKKASWGMIVQALIEMKENVIAQRIVSQYS